ncbi:MAG TPA: 2-oxoglutarate dehydrogenase E1 component, partial [Hyphomicrobium sp.]|nr:2-oxoglutarate dehydrogenase E1 component [Hyphomicrobium sp.]
MARNGQNEAFLRTSFLSAANAPYIEDMQAEYERNPGAVSDEWRRFFESIKEASAQFSSSNGGPAWAPPLSALLEESSTDRDLVGALTGDYGDTERTIRDKIERRAQISGFEMTPAASLRATQDSIRALMLIRAYRVIGHLAADLDPLGLVRQAPHRELDPATYGFTEADWDRPIL